MLTSYLCKDNNFDIVDKDIFPADRSTYVSSAWSTTSRLDQVACSSDAKLCTTYVEVMYECIFSDHHPMLGRVNLNILPECEENNSNDLKQCIHWDKLPAI